MLAEYQQRQLRMGRLLEIRALTYDKGAVSGGLVTAE
jgi:hypothetical protein